MRRLTPDARQRRRARWLRRLGSVVATLGLIAVFAGVPAGVLYSGLADAPIAAAERAGIWATAELGLYVQEVTVVGRQETRQDAVLQALDVRRGTPILAFSPEAARARLEALPWVKSATVERSLPDTVRVEIVERRAMAIWQNRGKFQILDDEGVAMQVADVGRFTGLPTLVGEDVPGNAAALLALLAKEKALAARVTAAVRVAGRRWNVRLDDRVDVKLPALDAAAAWAELAAMERKNGILARDILSIDMRLPDRLMVEMAPDAMKPQPAKPAGKPT